MATALRKKVTPLPVLALAIDTYSLLLTRHAPSLLMCGRQMVRGQQHPVSSVPSVSDASTNAGSADADLDSPAE